VKVDHVMFDRITGLWPDGHRPAPAIDQDQAVAVARDHRFAVFRGALEVPRPFHHDAASPLARLQKPLDRVNHNSVARHQATAKALGSIHVVASFTGNPVLEHAMLASDRMPCRGRESSTRGVQAEQGRTKRGMLTECHIED
jgi:hypothetical protein